MTLTQLPGSLCEDPLSVSELTVKINHKMSDGKIKIKKNVHRNENEDKRLTCRISELGMFSSGGLMRKL